jgi:hypothetical protein
MKQTLLVAACHRRLPPAQWPMTARPTAEIVGTFLGAVLPATPTRCVTWRTRITSSTTPSFRPGLNRSSTFCRCWQRPARPPKTSACSKMATMSSCTISGAMPSRSGPPRWCPFDIIRVDENGKVAEHWDALQPLVTETVSGRTQTDGPTEVTDLDQTEANKALAVALIEDVLMGATQPRSPTISAPKATPSTTPDRGRAGRDRRGRRGADGAGQHVRLHRDPRGAGRGQLCPDRQRGRMERPDARLL